MINRTISFLFALVFSAGLYAQDYYIPQDSSARKERKTSLQLELGTSIGSDLNGNTAVTTYVSPYVSHKIDERWRINIGGVMANTYMDGWSNYSMDRGFLGGGGLATYMLFTQLEYRVSERMLLQGTIYQNTTQMPAVPGLGEVPALEGYGYSLAMQYQMSKNAFLHVEIHQSTGYNPYVPRTNSGFGYGYGMSPFGSRYGGSPWMR